MVGSLITRAIIMVLGYLYPAYECFKTVEKNRPDMEHLRFWCQYCFVPCHYEDLQATVALRHELSDDTGTCHRHGEVGRCAHIMGTTYVYATFVRPFISQHEPEIDRNLNELRTRAGDWAFIYWQRGSTYFQTRFVELLQYLAAQSPRANSQSTRRGPPMSAAVPPGAPPPPPGVGVPGPTGPPRPPAPPPPTSGPTPPGSVRQRPLIIEEDDYDVVDSQESSVPPYLPDESVGGLAGYMTRSRQRNVSGRPPSR